MVNTNSSVIETVRLGSGDWVCGGSFRDGGPCLGTRPSKLRFAVPKVHVNRAVVFNSRETEAENRLRMPPPFPPRLLAQLLFYPRAATWAE